MQRKTAQFVESTNFQITEHLQLTQLGLFCLIVQTFLDFCIKDNASFKFYTILTVAPLKLNVTIQLGVFRFLLLLIVLNSNARSREEQLI